MRAPRPRLANIWEYGASVQNLEDGFTGRVHNFNNIALHLFRADNGTTLASATSAGQDVEQVSASYPGDALLAVSMTSSPLLGVSAEPYGAAFSVPGVRIQASGPRISLACNLPSSVTSGSQFSVTCNVANTGDLPAAGVAGQVTFSDGSLAPIPISLGDIQQGSAASTSFSLGAPYVAGSYALRIDVSTSSFFGSTDTNALAVMVSSALGPPVVASPANGATGVSTTSTLSWAATAGASSYDVYLGTSVPPPQAASTPGPTYSPGALVPGTLYYWRVVAKSASGSNSSAISSFTTAGSPPGPEQYVVATMAGGGMEPFLDGGPATSAMLYDAAGVAADCAGTVYIADTGDSIVRKVTPDGIITTVAGFGPYGYSGDGGPARAAQLSYPYGLALDSTGNLYIMDTGNDRVRKVALDGTISTVAGNGTDGFGGDGGPASGAQFHYPIGIALDAGGNLYIADSGNNRIRKIARDGTVSTVAGNGTAGYSGDNGPATSAELAAPRGVAVDAAGNLYIADSNNSRIRKVALDGTISTVAGNGAAGFSGDGGPAGSAQLYYPEGVALDAAGNLYIADPGNHRVREVRVDGTIATIAGTGDNWNYVAGGPATSVPVSLPDGLAVGTPDHLYIVGDGVVRVRRPADPACQYQLDQTAFVVSGAGDQVGVSVHTAPGCTWEVAGLPSWIYIPTPTYGQAIGLGTVYFNLTATGNPGTLRTATISVAGAAVQVMQAAGECSYAVSPNAFAPGGGTGSLLVITGPSCPWTVDSPPSWLTLSGPRSGIGSGTVSYSTASNPGASRAGTITVTGQLINVEQSGLSGTALRFIPITPCRVADTRGGGGAMAAAETRSFAVPQSGCGVPSSAQAYSLNVTVVPRGPLSFLTLWPTGQDKPLVSTLNSFGGIVVANAAIVPAGFDGAVSAYVTDPTDVILDINGYFDSPGSYAFYPVQPCRVADTRAAAGPFGGPALAGAQSRDFPVPSSSCGLPPTASAYSMNVTVVPGGYLGYLKTWPTGQAQPNVSTLNSWTGKVVANAAIVPAGTGGSISVYAEDATQVVLDTNGYFGAPGGTGALSFYPVAPCRVADTRYGGPPFGAPEMAAQETRSFPIPASGCNIPSTAQAYSLNVTVVPDGLLSYLTVWPTGAGQPFVSTLNSFDGSVVANAAIVPAGAGGAVSVFVTDPTHVIVDINGYFAP